MSIDDRLPDLLLDAARGAEPATYAGVEDAIRRRAERRRRQRVAGAGLGVVFVLGCAAAAVAVSGSSDPAPATRPPATELPLVGIDLVGFARDPDLEAQVRDGMAEPDGPALTYAVFTGDEPDVLGPMMTASLHPGPPDAVGTPVDLDGHNDPGGPLDGRLTTFPGGASVTWFADGTASLVGHGLPAEAVVTYAQQLSGEPFDLESMPAPEGLPNREVVTFGPVPDFDSRVAVSRGPSSVVHVLTTADPGYFDLTRIVSTEGEPYEQIELGDSFLGPGEAILSPDDDGPTSALVRTDAGLTVHVFGEGLDAQTLRTAIEHGHLIELEPPDPTVPTTTTSVVQGSDFGAGSSGTADGPVTLTDLRLERARDDLVRVVMTFDGGIPAWEMSTGPTQQRGGEGECVVGQPDAGQWVNIVLGTPGSGGVASNTPLVAGQTSSLQGNPVITATLTCAPYEGAARVDVALRDPVPPLQEIQTHEDPDRDQLVFDIPL